MDFDSKKVDKVADAALDILETYKSDLPAEAFELQRALSFRAMKQDEFTNRWLVEASESFISDVERTGPNSAEWQALGEAVDIAKKPVIDESHKMAVMMFAQGRSF